MTGLPAGESELGRLVHRYNWAETDLGSAEQWPASLKAAARMMLTATEPIWIGWGSSLSLLYNDAFKVLLGNQHPNALAQPASDALQAQWPILAPLVQTILDGGKAVARVAHHFPSHGSRPEQHFTVTCQPLLDDTGAIGGVICIYTSSEYSISGLANQTFSFDSIQLELLGRAMRMVSWEWDVAQDRITTSETFAEMYGLPALATVADGLALVLPDDKPAHLAKVQAIAVNGGEYQSEFRIRRPDNGEVVWLEERATAFTDAQGHVERVIGLTFDVTARKLIELQLRSTQARLETALKSGLAGTFFWDIRHDRVITDVNMQRYFSLPSAALAEGVPLEAVLPAIHEHDRDQVTTALNHAIATDSPYEVEYRVYHSDGSLRWLSARGSVERNPAGDEVGMSGFAVDVTRRKEAEAQLRMSEARQSFLLTLSDALRPLADPWAIQATASRVLGAYLQVTWAFYAEAEADTEHVVIHQDYHVGVPSAVGRYRIDDFGASLATAFRAGQTVVVDDVALVDDLSVEEREAYAAVDVRAHATVCLMKEGRLVALLGVRQAVPRAWTPFELALVEETAERTWAAVERSRSEGALRESEERYRNLLESVEQGFCVFEMIYDDSGTAIDYRFLEVNAMFEHHTGLQDAVGKNVRALVPNLEAHWFETYDTVAKTGEPLNFEQGSPAMGRWFAVEAVRVGGPGSRKVGLLFTDITVRKQSERDADFLSELSEQIRLSDQSTTLLGQSVQFLGQYVRAHHCFIAEIDDRYSRWRMLHAYESSDSRFSPSTQLSNYPDALLHSLQGGQMAILAGAAGDPARAYIAVPFLRDGHWTAALVVAHDAPRRWENREVALLETAAERIWNAIERLRFEAAQREETRRLQQLNAASLAINTTATRDILVQRIGDEGRALIGTNLAIVNLIPDGDTQSARRVVSQTDQISVEYVDIAQSCSAALDQRLYDERRPVLLDQHELHSFWSKSDSADRERRHLLPNGALATPLLAGNGTCLGAIQLYDRQAGVFTAADAALLQQLAQMAAVALEKQLLYEQEQAARAQAEAASRLKDEFLATVSHELRTPLTSLLGYAQLLQWRKRDEAYVARTIEKIVRSAKAQAQITEDLLDVSRIVSGKLRIEPHSLDLTAVIRTALDTVRPAIEAKGLLLELDLDPAAATIIGDPNRLQQVVWNLLSNAIKFTPTGGTITVTLRPEGRNACLQVGDTGQGIDPAFLAFVFDRFRQADSSSNRSHGGLGIGLAIVRHLVELHGGTVEAASSGVGQGTTFTVRLPLALVDDPAESPEANADLPETGCAPELSDVRVLVVDDQPEILEILDEILAPCGALVHLCATAREALDALRSWRPHVLVSDIAMPGEDGYWLIRAVRALGPEDGGTTPAIALTAFVRIEDRMRVLAEGFQLYVPKPIEPSDLRDAVVHLVQEGGNM